MEKVKQHLVLVAAMFTCAVSCAAPNSSVYRVTTDGALQFKSDITVSANSPTSAFAQGEKFEYVMACTGSAITQGNVETGTSIVLNRPDAIRAEEVDFVGISLKRSELKAIHPIATSNCTVQLPDVRGFNVSTRVSLPVGAKHLIAKDPETGESWFVERTR